MKAQLLSGSIYRDYIVTLPNNTKISATTMGIVGGTSGGFGKFCGWITRDKLVSDPHDFNLTEALAESQLQIVFWDIHTNKNFSTLNL